MDQTIFQKRKIHPVITNIFGFLILTIVIFIVLYLLGAPAIDINNPELYWLLSRSSALLAYILLWLSTFLGLFLTTKLAQKWRLARVINTIHQFTSFLGLFFILFHALILLGDAYISPSIAQLLIAFQFSAYEPFLIGLGQISLYLWAILILSFYFRKRIRRKVWRLIHYLSFVVYLFSTWHGVFAGTDTSLPWVSAMYILSFTSIMFLIVLRVLLALVIPKNQIMNNE